MPNRHLTRARLTCPTAGNTVAQTASVRIYSKTRNGDLDPLLACRFKDGKPFRLGVSARTRGSSRSCPGT